jgi:hypothetical protein
MAALGQRLFPHARRPLLDSGFILGQRSTFTGKGFDDAGPCSQPS